MHKNKMRTTCET